MEIDIDTVAADLIADKGIHSQILNLVKAAYKKGAKDQWDAIKELKEAIIKAERERE